MPHKDPEARRAYNAAQHRRRYAADPQLYIRQSKQQKESVREWLRGEKKQCARCPESHPACLDFHHRVSSEKTISLSRALSWGRRRLEAEVAKCEVLCANCHRKEHSESLTMAKTHAAPAKKAATPAPKPAPVPPPPTVMSDKVKAQLAQSEAVRRAMNPRPVPASMVAAAKAAPPAKPVNPLLPLRTAAKVADVVSAAAKKR